VTSQRRREWREHFAGVDVPVPLHGGSTVTGINFFYDTVAFRKEQFRGALTEPGILLEPEDWVIFVDAHEAFCIDTRDPQPNDVGTEPFRSAVLLRIQAGGDLVGCLARGVGQRVLGLLQRVTGRVEDAT
jgi:hypothetical protein